MYRPQSGILIKGRELFPLYAYKAVPVTVSHVSKLRLSLLFNLPVGKGTCQDTVKIIKEENSFMLIMNVAA